MAEMFQYTHDALTSQGLPAYEISNHAAPGEQSRHNLLYWRYGSYAGVGAGAHGRLIVDGARCATATICNPEHWLEQVERLESGLCERAPLSAAEQADEMLLMGLRLAEGVDLGRLQRLTGLAPGKAAIAELVRLELIEQAPDLRRIKASRQGRFMLNRLVLALAESLDPAGP